MNWREHDICRRGIRKEIVRPDSVLPDRLFDRPEREPTIAHDNTTTAMTHDKATGRSMHYPSRKEPAHDKPVAK